MFKIRHIGFDISGRNYQRVNRPEGSGDYLLLFLLSSMNICLEKGVIAAAPSAMILFEPGREQNYSSTRDFRLDYIHFTVPKAEMDRFGLPVGEVFYPKAPELVRRFIEQIFREFNTRDALYAEQMDALLRNLFVLISRDFVAKEKEEATHSTLYRLFLEARYTMLSNCEREWASTNMAQMVSLSRSQFYKYYNDFFGRSPMQDINEARIEKAKILLTNTEFSVTEVAEMVGYASIHHFSRTFKEHTGISPLQYIKSTRK